MVYWRCYNSLKTKITLPVHILSGGGAGEEWQVPIGVWKWSQGWSTQKNL